MSIPDYLLDTTIYTKNYASQVYVFCIILRIILGILIFNNAIPKCLIYLLSAFIIVAFSSKFIKFKRNNIQTWKVYERTIISYILLIYFTNNNKSTHNIGGLFVIFDVLLGLQSRHTVSNFLNN